MNETRALATADRRDALRAKIEAAERRNAERSLADQAREAAQAATEYTREHPLTVIAGAVALGLMVGLATRPGRRVARRALGGVSAAATGAASSAAAGVKDATGRGTAKIGTLIGDAALAWVMKVVEEMLETAREGQDRLEDFGDESEARARSVRREAGHTLGKAADTARAAAKRTQRKASRAVRDTARKVKG
ncbi:MAG: hypothetical protein GC147_00055 [Porphyrobacter sp.]|nr:hypothetical protein [Porphyrobacter sp.]